MVRADWGRRALASAVGGPLFLLALGRPTVASADEPSIRLVDPRITESSGLAASLRHPGIVWTHNDSGDRPRLFAVDTETGRTVATITLRGAPARDWEAMAAVRPPGGSAALWVGDVGDNRASWPYVRVYRVAEPATLRDADVPWTEYRLTYPDGPRNAETLLADPRTGGLLVVSKEASGGGVYQAPLPLRPAPEENRLVRVGAAPGTVTDGAFAPDGSRLALVGYVYGYLFDAPGGRPEPIDLPLRPQGESVTWTPDGRALLVGSEGRLSRLSTVAVATGGGSAAPAPSTPPASSAPAAAGDGGDQRPTGLFVLVGLAGLVGLAAAAVLRAIRRRGRPAARG